MTPTPNYAAQVANIMSACDMLQRLIAFNRRPSSAIRMRLESKEGDDTYEFEIIDRGRFKALPADEAARLNRGRDIVTRVLTRLQGGVRLRAEEMGFLSAYALYFDVHKVAIELHPTHSPKSGRTWFETFDDGRSVWTLPSNWSRKK